MHKRGIVWSEIARWVIGLALLALVAIAYILLRARGIDILEEIKNLLRGR